VSHRAHNVLTIVKIIGVTGRCCGE